ncbi:hypothetical protein BDA99DRAFT_51082 [Phascolomyces articulosus]|uniref:Centromere protein M n=1 Tax=Phascolomyces articulosus TaxID=60185 RepID=A0AAD5PEK8_9FUNG|nr:hypothetical protein BDA99DRAFT_51082 [Phascolomyces articulosus]
MILRPLYTQRPIEVLLIGPANSGKRTLANQLISCRDTFISTSTNEELPKNAFETLGHVDFIFFVLDMTNRQSLKVLERALERIAPDYLVNRCAVVATKIDALQISLMDEDRVQFIVDQYTSEMQVFRCNLSDDRERRKLCDQLARLIRINQLQQKNINMSLVKAAMYYNDLPYSSRSIDEGSEFSIRSGSHVASLIAMDQDNNINAEDVEEIRDEEMMDK